MVNSSNSSSRSSYYDPWYRADIWTTRRRTGIFEFPTGRHSVFIINVIKLRYVLCRFPCVSCEIITESIHSKSFRDFPDSDKLVVVVPPNPIAKQFPSICNCRPRSNSSTQLYPTALRHPELLQLKIILPWLVLWVQLVNWTKNLAMRRG